MCLFASLRLVSDDFQMKMCRLTDYSKNCYRQLCVPIKGWVSASFVQISKTVNSVDGLAAAVRTASSISVLSKEVLQRFAGRATRAFELEQFSTFVDSTRFWTAPAYFFSGEVQTDLKEGKSFKVLSKGFATVWDFGQLVRWMHQQGQPWVCRAVMNVQSCSKFFTSPKFGNVLSGISIAVFLTMAVERVREISQGEHLLFSSVDLGYQLAELSLSSLSMIPGVPVIPIALFGVVAASFGFISFLMDPD